MSKITKIFLVVFVAERTITYIAVSKHFKKIIHNHHVKLDETDRKAWKEGWDAGRLYGRTEGPIPFFDMKSSQN